MRIAELNSFLDTVCFLGLPERIGGSGTRAKISRIRNTGSKKIIARVLYYFITIPLCYEDYYSSGHSRFKINICLDEREVIFEIN
jgi:hypothetical protein